jgi:DNA-binding CsgD family transcriptional regulator
MSGSPAISGAIHTERLPFPFAGENILGKPGKQVGRQRRLFEGEGVKRAWNDNECAGAIQRAIAHHEASRGARGRLDIVRAHLASLTPREREVFELVVRGKTNKHIAAELGATERTIKAHRHRVMEKMQVQSLAELVSLAERLGTLAADSSRMKRGKAKWLLSGSRKQEPECFARGASCLDLDEGRRLRRYPE